MGSGGGMFRQRNDTGGVLAAYDLDGEARMIGPGEEFDCTLPVPGCTLLGRTDRAAQDEASEPDTAPDITEGPSGEELPA